VLADVGGPHVLAPVRGTLRAHGRRLGTFLLSVQDDLGYLKLVSRFIGVPIVLYQGGTRIMGTAPPGRSEGGTTTIAGRRYQRVDLALRAFPSGPLRASLLIADAPSPRSCASVRNEAWGSVARHVTARFHPLAAHLGDLAGLLRTVTNGRVLIRSGAHRIVGTGPRRLPLAGTVRWSGRRWAVYSWQPLPRVRAFLLTPPA
jgi:hypothetical protein